MLNRCRRLLALTLAVCCLSGHALAASKKTKPTPTPAPVAISTDVLEVPETIRQLLDLAHDEWEALGGKAIKKSNKYTKWRNDYEWGWCGGFITWCMLQLEVPQERLNDIQEGEVPGVVHVMEASVGKLLTGYLRMNRTTRVPQKGFLVVYGKKNAGGYVHVGLVWDVEVLPDGKYRLTTIEGNMSNTIRMYIRDYDMNAQSQSKNLTMVPKAERTREESRAFTYKIPSGWYINMFMMPWVPETDETPEAAATPGPER